MDKIKKVGVRKNLEFLAWSSEWKVSQKRGPQDKEQIRREDDQVIFSGDKDLELHGHG